MFPFLCLPCLHNVDCMHLVFFKGNAAVTIQRIFRGRRGFNSFKATLISAWDAKVQGCKTLPGGNELAELVLMLNFSVGKEGPEVKRIVAMSALLVKVTPSAPKSSIYRYFLTPTDYLGAESYRNCAKGGAVLGSPQHGTGRACQCSTARCVPFLCARCTSFRESSGPARGRRFETPLISY